jgi:outer membrane protein TolC
MNHKTLLHSELWLAAFLAACAGLGLAGCTTPPIAGLKPTTSSRTGDAAVKLRGGMETSDEIPTPEPSQVGRSEDHPSTGGVTLTQYEAVSPVDPPTPTLAPPALEAPTPPDTLPRMARKNTTDEARSSNDATPPVPENASQLNFSAALAMAAGQNPQIAFAAQRYAEAYARLQAARALWLPSIRAGVSYNKHDGRLQSAEGQVFDASRGSLSTGLGTQAVGTGSPAVPGLSARFHLSDAIFQPRIANRQAAARQEAVRATTLDLLLETALAYVGLLEASQQKAIAEATLENARELDNLTETFARTGQGSQADADRARTELVIRRNDVARAEESVAVASARLAELLHIDPGTEVVPEESTVVPVEFVERETPLAELLATGLSNRPELAESRHLVCEAVQRYRREKYAPLLPSAVLGVSYGEFGGGTGSTVGSFDDRFDFDAVAYWELRNFGLGERARRNEARSGQEQARLREIQAMDRVAREIVESHARVQSRYPRIAVAESGIQAAGDSYRRNLERIRAGEGLPIEALQSIQALDQARREYLRTVVEYSQAQLQLYWALGWPIH